MPDTSILLTLAVAVLALVVALVANRTAAEALRVARGATGAPSASAPLSRSDKKAAAQLAERAKALLLKVNALPPAMLGPGADSKVRDGALWSAAEVAALRDTSPALLEAGAEALATVEPALGWLLERVEAIRATPRGSGQYLIDFPHDTWRRHYQSALTGLQELAARGEAGAKG